LSDELGVGRVGNAGDADPAAAGDDSSGFGVEAAGSGDGAHVFRRSGGGRVSGGFELEVYRRRAGGSGVGASGHMDFRSSRLPEAAVDQFSESGTGSEG